MKAHRNFSVKVKTILSANFFTKVYLCLLNDLQKNKEHKEINSICKDTEMKKFNYLFFYPSITLPQDLISLEKDRLIPPTHLKGTEVINLLTSV